MRLPTRLPRIVAAVGCLVWLAGRSPLIAAGVDIGGFWQPAQPIAALRTLEGDSPPLTPAAQALYNRRLQAAKSGDRAFDNELTCRPPGIPRLLVQSAFELVQTDTELAFLFQWNRLQRPMEIRAQHSSFDRAYPYYLGHPIASWQGDTLTIDSIDFNDDTLLDDSGLPHSDALHVVEHLRLTDHDTLEDTLSIEDPKSFTRTWQTRLRFKRLSPETHFDEDVCVERLGLKTLNTHKNHLPGAH